MLSVIVKSILISTCPGPMALGSGHDGELNHEKSSAFSLFLFRAKSVTLYLLLQLSSIYVLVLPYAKLSPRSEGGAFPRPFLPAS